MKQGLLTTDFELSKTNLKKDLDVSSASTKITLEVKFEKITYKRNLKKTSIKRVQS